MEAMPSAAIAIDRPPGTATFFIAFADVVTDNKVTYEKLSGERQLHDDDDTFWLFMVMVHT